MNKYYQEKKPFLFILDFDLKTPIILPADEINPDEIKFSLNGISNQRNTENHFKPASLSHSNIDFSSYSECFQKVQKEIKHGNSYLLNLTFKTQIDHNSNLENIFHQSNAPYKLFMKDRFVLFSPESFVKIDGDRICTYPMKGTMIKESENSKQELLENVKESAEHATITDLLRNDLSKVAFNVKVDNYRYVDEIATQEKTILQVSSKISGELLPKFQSNPGDVFMKLLPAGSVTGAPKTKTIEIIKEVEDYNRGFYTGIFGYFNGENIDSGVMIRFIEKEGEKYFYKSGGGITFMSDAEKEYKELIDKIYVPIH